MEDRREAEVDYEARKLWFLASLRCAWKQPWRLPPPCSHLVRPDLEALQRVGAERVADRDISGIATPRD